MKCLSGHHHVLKEILKKHQLAEWSSRMGYVRVKKLLGKRREGVEEVTFLVDADAFTQLYIVLQLYKLQILML